MALMEFGLLALWLVVFAVLWIAGLPLADLLFDSLPSSGAGFAVPISLTILTLAVYWIGQLTFGLLAIGIAIVALLTASAFAVRQGASVDPSVGKDTAVVFVACFLFMAFAQAKTLGVVPWSEDFLDFGLLKSVLRTSQLPPEDMWLAGEAVNYYYGGHLVTAILSRVTGTAPRYAYSLAIAGFYAMLVTAAYELAGTIATTQGRSRTVAGFVGALLVGFGGTLVTTLQMVLWTLPGTISEPLATGLNGHLGATHADQLLASSSEFELWRTAFAVPDAIVEPPLFGWLTADLHAHKMSTPFLVLLGAVLYAYYRTSSERRRRQQTLLFGVVPLLVGFLALLNTWDVPTALGLTWLTLTFASARPLSLLGNRFFHPEDVRGQIAWDGSSVHPLVSEIFRVLEAILVTLVVGALSFVVAVPYLGRAASGSSIQLVAPGSRSGLVAFALVHGAFLVLFVAYFETLRESIDMPEFDWLSPSGLAVGSLFLLILAMAWLRQLVAPLLAVILLSAFWYSMRGDRGTRFETVLIVAGLGLVVLVELVYLAHQFDEGRFNTVFKIYVHVWIFWGIAAGALFSRAATGPVDAIDGVHPRRFVRPILAIVVILTMLVYGGMAVDQRVGIDRGASLDSSRFATSEHPEEFEAIQWLDNREGTPTMVSAPGTDRLTWNASTAASFTGVPTLAGQASSRQYHGPETYNQRVEIVDEIYNSSAERRGELLKEHDVRYIYLGPGERERYGTVAPFDEIPGISEAFKNEVVTIYRVDQSELEDTTGTG
jgi:YYY domain-containing protein